MELKIQGRAAAELVCSPTFGRVSRRRSEEHRDFRKKCVAFAQHRDFVFEIVLRKINKQWDFSRVEDTNIKYETRIALLHV